MLALCLGGGVLVVVNGIAAKCKYTVYYTYRDFLDELPVFLYVIPYSYHYSFVSVVNELY